MKRNIAASTIYGFLTCGIYMIYWMYKLTEELNLMAKKKEYANGVTVIVLTLASFGLFGFVWAYQMSKNIDIICTIHGDKVPKYGLFFIFMQAFMLPVVSFAIMQNTINKYAIEV